MDGRMGQEAAPQTVTASSLVAGVVESGPIEGSRGLARHNLNFGTAKGGLLIAY